MKWRKKKEKRKRGKDKEAKEERGEGRDGGRDEGMKDKKKGRWTRIAKWSEGGGSFGVQTIPTGGVEHPLTRCGRENPFAVSSEGEKGQDWTGLDWAHRNRRQGHRDAIGQHSLKTSERFFFLFLVFFFLSFTRSGKWESGRGRR